MSAYWAIILGGVVVALFVRATRWALRRDRIERRTRMPRVFSRAEKRQLELLERLFIDYQEGD